MFYREKTYRHPNTRRRETCWAIISRGQNTAEMIRRAYILLKSNDGKIDCEIADELYIDARTIIPHASALNKQEIAQLTTLACSPPPARQKRWTHKLPSAQTFTDGVLETISASIVGRYLKKRTEALAGAKLMCADITRLFIEWMEAILQLYHQLMDPKHPLVNFDERSV